MDTSELQERRKFHWPTDPSCLFYLQGLGQNEGILEQILNESSKEIVGEFLNFLLIFSIHLIPRLVLFKTEYVLTIKASLLMKSCISFAPTTDKLRLWEGVTVLRRRRGLQGIPLPCSWQVTMVPRAGLFFYFILTQLIHVFPQLPHRANLIIIAVVQVMQMKSIINCTNDSKRQF